MPAPKDTFIDEKKKKLRDKFCEYVVGAPGGYQFKKTTNTEVFLSFVGAALREAIELGLREGMTLEAIHCDKHCKESIADERERIIDLISSRTNETV